MATEKKDTAPKETPAKEALKLKAGQLYTIIGTGKAGLAKGAEYEVLGGDAEIIINAGKATLKG
jgi:hypothetical protein